MYKYEIPSNEERDDHLSLAHQKITIVIAIIIVAHQEITIVIAIIIVESLSPSMVFSFRDFHISFCVCVRFFVIGFSHLHKFSA